MRSGATSFPVAELDYDLPPELIAQAPAANRSDSRLLVLNRSDGSLADHRFTDLLDLLSCDDLLVLNNTRVIPARFELRRATGGRIAGLFLHEREGGTWEVMLKNAGRVNPKERLSFVTPSGREIRNPQSAIRNPLGQGCYLLQIEPPVAAMELLSQVGRPPLPPYIRREAVADDRDAADVERYQTVYAQRPGAVAAPTAGLHFSLDLLDELARRGIQRDEVTLHVGAGTFAPVTVDDLRDHEMHAEWYELSPEAAERINTRRAGGGRVVAVGTTSVRVLESCADPQCATALEQSSSERALSSLVTPGGPLRAGNGWTRIFCYPPYRFRAVDAMITNFHLPRSTLLALVMAFAGVEPIRRAYRHAIERGYRFFSGAAVSAAPCRRDARTTISHPYLDAHQRAEPVAFRCRVPLDPARGHHYAAAMPAVKARKIIPAVRTRGIRYAIRDILAVADEAKAAGRDMLYLNVGDPNIFDFAPPRHVIDDAYNAMLKNRLGYASSSGIPESVGAVRRYAEKKGIHDIQHIYITTGCSEAIDLGLSALVNPGENVLTPTPGYPLYTAILSKLAAENRPYFLDEARGWTPDIDDLRSKIDEKTRALVLINPNNPTGSLYPRESLEAVVHLAAEHNIVVFSDEIYDQLIFDGKKHVSTAALSAEVPVLTFNGLSKSYVVPGFRMGWGVISGPAEVLDDYCEAIRRMERARLSANHPEQYAVPGALEGDQSNLHDMVKRLQRRRDVTVEALNAIPGMSCVKPEGAFYAFPKIDLGISDDQFCAEVIRETGVVVVPGSGFGQRPGTAHFRVVFLPPEEILHKAFDRIASIARRYRH